MTIWYALEEMKSRTGLREPQICGVFFSLSLRAIVHEPFRYVTSVVRAHQEFWGRRQLAYGARLIAFVVLGPRCRGAMVVSMPMGFNAFCSV